MCSYAVVASTPGDGPADRLTAATDSRGSMNSTEEQLRSKLNDCDTVDEHAALLTELAQLTLSKVGCTKSGLAVCTPLGMIARGTRVRRLGR